MSAVRLSDLNIKDFNIDQKRFIFMSLDIFMKKCHEKGYMIDSFDPKNILYEDELFYFKEIVPISSIQFHDKNKAILNNIVGLSDLAFCSYLPDYNFDNGLLNPKVIGESLDRFKNIFDSNDFKYYEDVFKSYVSNKLPENVYYYDYVDKIEKNSGSNKSPAYVKATAAGKAFADNQNNESGYGRGLFVPLFASVIILLFAFMTFLFLQ